MNLGSIITLPGWMIRRSGLIGKSLYFLIITWVVYVLTNHWAYDDPFITYRYAVNIWAGNGFVYNLGEHVLSTTTPLFAVLLASLSWIWSDLPKLAVFVGSASLAASALVLFQLASVQHTPIIGWVCLLFYPTFPLILQTLGSETPLYVLLVLGSMLTIQQKRYSLTGLLSGLVVLTRPDGLLVPFLLVVYFLVFNLRRQPIPWKAVFILVAINLVWFGFAWLYFGSPLPVTLAAKQHQGMMAISERFLPGILTVIKWYAPSWGYRIAAVLIGIGALYTLKERRWLLVLTWTLAYFVAYALLGVSRYYWYYAPLVPGIVILMGAGINGVWGTIVKNKGWRLFVPCGLLLSVFIFLTFTQLTQFFKFQSALDVRIPVYKEVGLWLAENTATNASVGVLEVGAIGYYSRRKMIDFAGLIQPDVARQLTRDTTYEDSAIYAISTYKPDYIALNSGIFPKLRAGFISQNCQFVRPFQTDRSAVDLFLCNRQE